MPPQYIDFPTAWWRLSGTKKGGAANTNFRSRRLDPNSSTYNLELQLPCASSLGSFPTHDCRSNRGHISASGLTFNPSPPHTVGSHPRSRSLPRFANPFSQNIKSQYRSRSESPDPSQLDSRSDSGRHSPLSTSSFFSVQSERCDFIDSRQCLLSPPDTPSEIGRTAADPTDCYDQVKMSPFDFDRPSSSQEEDLSGNLEDDETSADSTTGIAEFQHTPEMARRIAEIRARIRPQVRQLVGQYINKSSILSDDSAFDLERRLGLESPARVPSHRLGMPLHSVEEDEHEVGEDEVEEGRGSTVMTLIDSHDELTDQNTCALDGAPPPPDVSRHRRQTSDACRRSLDRDWFSRWRTPANPPTTSQTSSNAFLRSTPTSQTTRLSGIVPETTHPFNTTVADTVASPSSSLASSSSTPVLEQTSSFNPTNDPIWPMSLSNSSVPATPALGSTAMFSQQPLPVSDSDTISSSRSVLSVRSALSARSTSRASTPATPFSPDKEKVVRNSKLSFFGGSPVSQDESFDLLSPVQSHQPTSLGRPDVAAAAIRLLSTPHMEAIVADPAALQRFTAFLVRSRPASLPMLVYFLDATKALRAIGYANAIADALDPIPGHSFTHYQPRPTVNSILEKKAQGALEALTNQDLPSYVTDILVGRVSDIVQRKITGSLKRSPWSPIRPDEPDSMAESFCLTDPSQPGNPIVFASEEFCHMSQHNSSYVIGQNPSFLNGPATSRAAMTRIREAIVARRSHTEVVVNYRRDGTAFPNLLMVAPLTDNRGTVRYFIGAQVDASNIIRLDGDMLSNERPTKKPIVKVTPAEPDEFRDLCDMLNVDEIETVREHGGRMHRDLVGPPGFTQGGVSSLGHSAETPPAFPASLPTESIFRHFLIVRPAPSLKIIFTSSSMRLPGILQSSFLSRIGGSPRVRAELESALSVGRSVTAKIRWLTGSSAAAHSQSQSQSSNGPVSSSASSVSSVSSVTTATANAGRPRWIHCTPLFSSAGQVGVWMVVLIDEAGSKPASKFRESPPVASDVRSATPTNLSRASSLKACSQSGIERSASPGLNWQL